MGEKSEDYPEKSWLHRQLDAVGEVVDVVSPPRGGVMVSPDLHKRYSEFIGPKERVRWTGKGLPEIFSGGKWRSGPSTKEVFLKWYRSHAKRQGLNPDPYDSRHYYDYEGAWLSGASPDATGHWPSEFKKEGHPRMVVDGINTKTGKKEKTAMSPGGMSPSQGLMAPPIPPPMSPPPKEAGGEGNPLSPGTPGMMGQSENAPAEAAPKFDLNTVTRQLIDTVPQANHSKFMKLWGQIIDLMTNAPESPSVSP